MTFISSLLSFLPESLPTVWALSSAHSSEDDYSGGRHSKPCRACTDFQSWVKASKSKPTTTSSSSSSTNTKAINDNNNKDNSLDHSRRKDCPLDRQELGRNSWSLFHTMAAYYPEKPSNYEQTSMQNFIKAMSMFYPCEHCADDFRKDIEKHPPKTGSRKELSLWWCDAHNRVNRKLGKPEFDCSNIDQRWLDGWKDGSCD